MSPSARNIGRLAAAVLLPVLLAGCSTTTPSQPFVATPVAAEADVQIANETTFVIRTAAELRAAWAQLYPRTAPAIPSIDFSTNMLVIVTLGTRPTLGYSVQISGVTRERGGIVVHVRVNDPNGPGCVTAQMQSGPIAMARMPQTRDNVRFEFTRTVGCR